VGKSNIQKKVKWNGDKIRELRRQLKLTQRELADELGTRQQTISEWETNIYQPRGASATLLTIVAEKAKFKYEAATIPAEKDIV
jgi:DNA-binding transcriptional regulator YiaG